MNKVTIQALKKEKTGKGVARKMRAAGEVPAVLYYKGKSDMLQLDGITARRMFVGRRYETLLVQLALADNTFRHAIVKDFQVHPVTGKLLHLDFQEIKMDEHIKVHIHIKVEGTPKGVKEEGGVLRHGVHRVLAEGLPDDMQDEIKLDITDLALGEFIHVKDLPIPSNIKIMSRGDDFVVGIIKQK